MCESVLVIKTDLVGIYFINKVENELNMETFNLEEFKKNGINYEFIQDNESFSKKGVLRGLHIQLKQPQCKLINVLEGEIFDVVVDMRKNSKTYLQWRGYKLSSQDRRMLYVGKGFAHGFLVLSDFAKVSFKVSNEWNPNDEVGIPWDDDLLNIKWPLNKDEIILSDKDQKYISLMNNEIGV